MVTNLKNGTISINNIGKPNLLIAFSEHQTHSTNQHFNYFPSEFDDDDDCDFMVQNQFDDLMSYGFSLEDINSLVQYSMMAEKASNKSKKKSSYRKRMTVSEETKKKIEKKKKKLQNDTRTFETSDNTTTIFFYRDYKNPDDYEVFHNLHDFDEFCYSEGIEISEEEVKKLVKQNISYCCVSPISQVAQLKTLISDTSYGALRWTCTDEDFN